MTEWIDATEHTPEEGVIVVGWWGPVTVAPVVYQLGRWCRPGAKPFSLLRPPVLWTHQIDLPFVPRSVEVLPGAA